MSGSCPYAPIGMYTDLSRIRTDLDGDGALHDPVTPLRGMLNVMLEAKKDAPTIFLFDHADGYWRQIYLNATLAPLSLLQAFDHGETRDTLRDLILIEQSNPGNWERWSVRDGMSIAALLSVRWPLINDREHAYMIQHLEVNPDLGRRIWHAASAETDDNLKWMAGPSQSSLFSDRLGTRFAPDADLAKRWLAALDNAEAEMAWQKLIPLRYYSTGPVIGINLASYLQHQKRLDIVMILTTRDLLPHLEDGTVLSRAKIREISDLAPILLSLDLFR
ncbi:hypothetical protein [Actibacterium sp. 188UL27-1]|uniref:hypothetical protein n=1 Tax=Actibacterium sp. 188UL27-1 TaxID=2786961 RepID=UPI00195AF970|nr:hypothetical protein [Actibacterium sp. 188UL27-1]MBM7066384.1 hypothetical protein [Actibacterium sp. 188UL27-1]